MNDFSDSRVRAERDGNRAIRATSWELHYLYLEWLAYNNTITTQVSLWTPSGEFCKNGAMRRDARGYRVGLASIRTDGDSIDSCGMWDTGS